MEKRLLFLKTLFLIFILLRVSETHTQEITIYTIPSPKGINWRSPRGLVLSYIYNTLAKSPYGNRKHPIGHMMVELKDSSRHALVGSTSEPHSGMTKKVLRKGYGLGILFEIIRGRLEEKDFNLPQVLQRSEAGDIAFVTYKINTPIFNRLWQYLQEYKQKGYDKLYNGGNKPREGRGAGCSAFAESFLEVGGLADVLPANEWTSRVMVPEKLIGGQETNIRHVQLIKLFFSGRWAKSGKHTYRELSLYDPTLFYHWIVKKYNSDAVDNRITKSNLGKAKGFTIDCSNNLPPEEPIWMNTASK